MKLRIRAIPGIIVVLLAQSASAIPRLGRVEAFRPFREASIERYRYERPAVARARPEAVTRIKRYQRPENLSPAGLRLTEKAILGFDSAQRRPSYSVQHWHDEFKAMLARAVHERWPRTPTK